jgi:hypothetical protein
MAKLDQPEASEAFRIWASRALWLLMLVLPAFTLVWAVRALLNWDRNNDLYAQGLAIGLGVGIVMSAVVAVVVGAAAQRVRSGSFNFGVWLAAVVLSVALLAEFFVR